MGIESNLQSHSKQSTVQGEVGRTPSDPSRSWLLAGGSSGTTKSIAIRVSDCTRPRTFTTGCEGADEERRQTLLKAYARDPERFVRKMPEPPMLSGAVWVIPPKLTSGESQTDPALHYIQSAGVSNPSTLSSWVSRRTPRSLRSGVSRPSH